MRAFRRYSPILVVVGIAAALLAAVFRLVGGEVNARVQISIAVALVLLAAYLALESESIQKWAGGRQARYGANAAAMSLAVVAIVGILNYLSNDRYHKDWDLTENKANTLAQQTIDVLAGLKEPVKVTAFISGQNQSYLDSTRRLLNSYRDNSNGKLSYEIVDPDIKRALAETMGGTKGATVIFSMGDHKEETEFGAEQDFTSALIRLTHPEKRVVYFLTGHGEASLDETGDGGYSKVKAGLERQNYTVQTLNLIVTDTVPSDAAALVIAGPQVTYTVTEALTLGKYLDKGGGAILLLNPTLQMREDQRGDDPLVNWLSATWGIQVENDVVIDLASSRRELAIAQAYGKSPITDKLLSQQLASVYPLARSISVSAAGDTALQATVNPLALTGDNSWGETDLTQQPNPDDGVDHFGPLNLAVTAEDPSTRARIVVFGDADFSTNVNADQYANGDMLLNSVNWVTGNTDLISIPPKDPSFRQPLDLRNIAILGIMSVFVLPFGVLIAGAVVVWSRRNRYK